MTINRKLYSRLLKQHKVKRKEINFKKNTEAKRAIMRELIHTYGLETESRRQTLKKLQQHGLTVPKEVSSDPFTWSGLRLFGAKEKKYERSLTSRIKHLKSDTIPTEAQMYPSRSFFKDEYVYIVKIKLNNGKTKSVLIFADKPLSRKYVERVVGRAIRTGDFEDDSMLFEKSPPLDEIDFGSIVDFSVEGLMRGTR